jgi:hypothetical protein
VNAIPDKFARWDAAYLLRCAVSSGAPGVRGASGQCPDGEIQRLVLLPNASRAEPLGGSRHNTHLADQNQFKTPLRGAGTLTSPTGRWEGKPPVRCRGRPDW